MIYTYLLFKGDVFDSVKYPNIDSQINTRVVLNRVARLVAADLDLRSTKRRATTSPSLFDGIYDVACPSDVKRNSFIDLQPQINRSRFLEWGLTTPEELDRRKGWDSEPLVAFMDENGLRRLRVSVQLPSDILTVSTLDDLTSGGGAWSAVGDATNLSSDADNYVKGSSSVRYDIGSGGLTTAGIQNTTLDEFDYSDFVNNNRSVFIWAYIVSTTNLTNFIFRVGSDSSNYHQITVTTTNEGTAFHTGWNLLRFDFASKTITGAPDSTNATYAAIYMTKDGAKVSETGYRFDQIIMEQGSIHDLYYYTKYPWQTSAGAYLENSTANTDLLNADTEEYDLFVLRGKAEGFKELKDFDAWKIAIQDYKDAATAYKLTYPSEARPMTIILTYS